MKFPKVINQALQKVFGISESKPASPRLTSPIGFSSGWIGKKEWLVDEGSFLSDYYRYLRVRVPMVANGIRIWVDLSTSGNTVSLEGGSKDDQEQAQVLLHDLDRRAYEFDYEWGSGFQRLSELFFLNFYTNGRFCAEIVPFADMSGIAYVALVDPFSVRLKREGDHVKLYQSKLSENRVMEDSPLPKDRIFYAAFDPDPKNPMGCSILDSVRWVVEVKEKLLEDMAKASHNAGFPRIKVSVAPPPQLPGESVSDYVGRVNNDFDETVKQFRSLAPEDNIFSMSNINIDYMAAAGGQDFQWSINLSRIEDEIVAGLGLFGWLVGTSSSSTKNWVDSQHEVLMQRVQRGAQHGIRFMDWVRNTELRLRGCPVRASQDFKPLRDPGRLIDERAKQWELQRVDQMVQRGYISKDEGARQIGLDRAHRQDTPEEMFLSTTQRGKPGKSAN